MNWIAYEAMNETANSLNGYADDFFITCSGLQRSILNLTNELIGWTNHTFGEQKHPDFTFTDFDDEKGVTHGCFFFEKDYDKLQRQSKMLRIRYTNYLGIKAIVERYTEKTNLPFYLFLGNTKAQFEGATEKHNNVLSHTQSLLKEKQKTNTLDGTETFIAQLRFIEQDQDLYTLYKPTFMTMNRRSVKTLNVKDRYLELHDISEEYDKAIKN